MQLSLHSLLSPTKSLSDCSHMTMRSQVALGHGSRGPQGPQQMTSPLAEPQHVPQQFLVLSHAKSTCCTIRGETSPLKGALPSRPNCRCFHGPIPSYPKGQTLFLRQISFSFCSRSPHRVVACLWSPSSPPGSTSCRPAPMQQGLIKLKDCSLQLHTAL